MESERTPLPDTTLDSLLSRCEDESKSKKYRNIIVTADKLILGSEGKPSYQAWGWFYKACGYCNIGRQAECLKCYKNGISTLTNTSVSLSKKHKTLLRKLRKAQRAAQSRFQSLKGDANESKKSDVVEGSRGKFPSIPHLSFSPQVHSDDIKLDEDTSKLFIGQEVIVTEKMDGGNCCLYNGQVYARTHKHPAKHPSFSPIKSLYAGILHDLNYPKAAYFGENMVAVHSIPYRRLAAFYYLFSIREQNGRWLSWADVEVEAKAIGVPHPAVIFKGKFSSTEQIRRLMDQRAKELSTACDTCTPEGFVIRIARAFSDEEFKNGKAVAKYVRKGHCQTDRKWGAHWKKSKLNPKPPPPPLTIKDIAGPLASSDYNCPKRAEKDVKTLNELKT
ncbi:hypothetical protein AAMO2058_001190800 [Amorphochlora amoebiformis]